MDEFSIIFSREDMRRCIAPSNKINYSEFCDFIKNNNDLIWYHECDHLENKNTAKTKIEKPELAVPKRECNEKETALLISYFGGGFIIIDFHKVKSFYFNIIYNLINQLEITHLHDRKFKENINISNLKNYIYLNHVKRGISDIHGDNNKIKATVIRDLYNKNGKTIFYRSRNNILIPIKKEQFENAVKKSTYLSLAESVNEYSIKHLNKYNIDQSCLAIYKFDNELGYSQLELVWTKDGIIQIIVNNKLDKEFYNIIDDFADILNLSISPASI